jgi:hypothetical protein
MSDAAVEPFVRVLHPDALRQLTDSPSWERGERYFKEGRVGELHRQGGTIKATVSGSSAYEVRIWVKGDRLAYSCTCPSADKGFFCKHCVAVALAWLVPLGDARSASERPRVDEPDETAVGKKAPSIPAPSPRREVGATPSGPGRGAPAAAAPTPPEWEPGRVHAMLRERDSAALADILLDHAARDADLRVRLMRMLTEG